MHEIEYGFDEEYEFYPKALLAKYLARLKECNAPQEVILKFHSLIRTADGMIEELQDPIERYLLEACRTHNFIRPFESIGAPRFFRPADLPCNHPDHIKDTRTNSNPGEEQAYRLGFSEGFAEAMRKIEEGANIQNLQDRQQKINAWRFARVQSFGSPPGFEQELENGVKNFGRRISIPLRLRMEILKADGFRCRLCGASPDHGVTLEVDHIVPVSKGGTNQADNLQTLCFECNRGKADQII